MRGPAWLYEIRPDSLLTANDIRPMLGVTPMQFDRLIRDGEFPSEDVRVGSSLSTAATDRPKTKKREWFVKTVIRYFRSIQGKKVAL